VFETAAAIFSVLLIVTGIAKLIRPTETARAVASLGIPEHKGVGLAIGAGEVMIGSAALILAHPAAYAIQGTTYLLFTAWVLVALRRDIPLASCGCLGRSDTPPYWGHLLLDVSAAVVSFAAFAAGGGGVLGLGVPGNLAQIALIGAGSLLAWVVLDDGARLYGALKK